MIKDDDNDNPLRDQFYGVVVDIVDQDDHVREKEEPNVGIGEFDNFSLNEYHNTDPDAVIHLNQSFRGHQSVALASPIVSAHIDRAQN